MLAYIELYAGQEFRGGGDAYYTKTDVAFQNPVCREDRLAFPLPVASPQTVSDYVSV